MIIRCELLKALINFNKVDVLAKESIKLFQLNLKADSSYRSIRFQNSLAVDTYRSGANKLMIAFLSSLHFFPPWKLFKK
jgi:cellulose synthase/poly-beta-1,6-N-acetylglucosamine synthase-like glycosyltransferase